MNPLERDYFTFTVDVARRQREAILSAPPQPESMPCAFPNCERTASLIDHDLFDRTKTYMCPDEHVSVKEDV